MSTPPIHLDGSLGEGGGQILRTALALSLSTGRAFRMEKIRAGRSKPGLLRQHLTAVNAAAAICGSSAPRVAHLGSTSLQFEPGPVQPGSYTFAVGSAGSTTLVAQTILPPLLTAAGPSSITFEGGTHNPHAPPLDFLEKAFLPLVNRMGPTAHVALERAGFYPAGGGRFFLNITPAPKLSPLHLPERGDVTHRLAKAVVAGLPGEIAKRELAIVRKRLEWTEEDVRIKQLPDEWGPGNVLTIEIGSAHITEVFTGFGMKGKTAEAVAEDAARQASVYLAAGVPVGECLADQLLLPMALAGGGSFQTLTPTSHSRTHAEVIARFLDVRVQFVELGKNRWQVTVQ